jgi:tetratricopeptide (TPR) repeat protein
MYRLHAIIKTAVLLLCLLFGAGVFAQSEAKCDSLIRGGIDAMWKKDYARSIELLTEARTMAVKNHWPKQEFLAINNLGANYYAMLDYGEALNHYLESYTLAVKKLKPVNEMVVLNNIAILYSKEKNHEKAHEYFTKAYEIAKENNDSIKIGLYAMNLGNAANERGRLKEARKYIDEAIVYMRPEPQMKDLAEAALAENMMLAGNYTAARQKATAILKNTPDADFNNVGVTLHLVIAKSLRGEKRYGEAVTEIKEMLATNPALDIKKDLYGLLSEVYQGSAEFNRALQYKDSVLWAEEEINKIKNGELYQTNRVKFEIQDYKTQLAINAEKLKAERNLFYYLIAGIIALLAIIVLIARNISVKNRQKQLLAERNEKEMALELEREKNENLELERQIAEKETAALLEQERLRNEIEVRNRKLSAKALYLSGRNDLIEDVVNSLAGNPALANNPALAQHIRSLKSHVKNNDEWDSFLTHFEEVNHALLEKLKTRHPALTANDLRFIAYIYMNLSNKEIATMLNITPEACRKRKERLASKMELPEETSLYDYLSFI